MKHIKIIALSFLFTGLALTQVKAQFLAGFFSQQSNKEKIMAEQIADLQIYEQALTKGYGIAQKGLNTAQDLKNGMFGLHSAYFNSLEQVNPVVSNDPNGKAILDLQQQLISRFTAEISWQQQQKLLQTNELAYLQSVYDNLLKEDKKDVDELTLVLTPGKMQLTDQQRLDRLDRLYASVKDKYAFAGDFTGKCRKLALGRQQAIQEKEQLKKLYGVQ
ncbi:hypothetical protein SAMN05216464_11852 [Mucilaginibacter pineti]|uniref:Uncharacterized protein n=1 Tax=Mucilaginibacter pineti TaxID=1391627 RepID=A0A1G7L664_9SPHI|nr:hypothetical protein [Mucilaginibacter pineti]SDF44943.1 hypothetical protein SAMN05216464_11852 [Mucilaginibacter pineti]